MKTKKIDQKDIVLQEIRRASEIPAMANTIRHIQDFEAFEEQNITEIANTILKDYALTTKLLRVVNSVIYLQFGEVTTISRAIFLLGIEQIKEIALTLMVFDHLQKHSSQPIILEVISQAFFSGFFAREIVHDLEFVEEEEGFICAMLHSLGKLLAAFAMPEKVAEIQKLSQEKKVSENHAAVEILGISFEEIGTTIATEWNFPQRIVQGMKNCRLSDITSNPREGEKLCLVATLSTQIANTLAADSPKGEKTDEIKGLLHLYKEYIQVPEKLDSLITTATQDLNKLASQLNLNLDKTFFKKQLSHWSTTEGQDRSGAKVLEYETEALKTIDTLFGTEEPENDETIFRQGIQDINISMLQSYTLDDILRIALETIHRGMKTSRILKTLFLIRDTQRPIMKVRFGFGDHIEDTQKWFVIEIGEAGDVFNLALSKTSDLMVKDIYAPDMKRLIPSWYRKNVFTPLYLILLPISVDRRNIGLICLEGDQKGFENISKGHLNYLRILRDQIVLAISQLASDK